ncbi:MAG TPA: nucleotidyltransferase family protein [Acidimicrobiia bacterium]|nr:nucleotidyltransferase family protein [Acidimicrobiia bacterium]
MIAALVLAAGGSSRLGAPKQLLRWGDTTLLGHVLDTLRGLPFDEVFVVIGANGDEILDQVDLSGTSVIENPEWEEGMASSLRVGLDAVLRLSRADAVVIFLGDQPDISEEVVNGLIEARRSTKRQAIVPKYRYVWGNPVLVERSLWPRLMSLEGDEGAKRLLQAHPDWVHEVWFEQRPPRDVDTRADFEELRPRQ